jgi:hypothetical protein
MVLENPNESELVKFECARSMVLLGFWNDDIFNILNKCLMSTNKTIKIDVLKTIIEAKNPQFTNIVRILSTMTLIRYFILIK